MHHSIINSSKYVCVQCTHNFLASRVVVNGQFGERRVDRCEILLALWSHGRSRLRAAE